MVEKDQQSGDPQISSTLSLVHRPLVISLPASINSPWQQWSKTAAHLALFFLTDVALLACATLPWRLFESHTDVIRRHLFESRGRTAAHLAALP